MKISRWRVPPEWVWVQDIAIVAVAVLVAVLAHALAMRILLRTGRRRTRVLARRLAG